MNGSARKRSAIVVGAGAGGIATAARLAHEGFQVTVLEKNSHTGGRCSLLYTEGYRFDLGPSLLLLPGLFRKTFADLHTSLEAEKVELLKCEPNYEIHFSDGERMTLSSDLSVMKREVEKWEGKDGFEAYLGWLQEGHRHYEVSVEHVLKKNFYGISSMVRPSFLKYIWTLHPFISVWSRAKRYFKTERMRRAMTFGSMYLGMSPYDAPGTYSLLQYTELAEGIWYPRGGFYKVLEALQSVGQRLGVNYRLNTPVSKVLISSDNRATGVLLESGETLTADVVVLNCDLVHAYTNLLPPSRYSKSLKKRHHSCSSISFYWAMNRQIPALSTHNIFLASEYRDSFDAIFNRQQMPDEPSFYVNVPSRVDPTAAPEGKDSIVVLVPIGHLIDTDETDSGARVLDMVARARDLIIQTIEARTGEHNIRAAIASEIINTPFTWRERFNLTHGAILGLSHSFFNVLGFRPHTKHDGFKDLYFVGASAHPGTGVPICLAGAKLTTQQILEDCGVRKKVGLWEEAREGWEIVIAGLLAVAMVFTLLLMGMA